MVQQYSKCDVCNKVRETFSLDWDNCVTHSSDNTISLIGKRNSLPQKIQNAQGDKKIFDVGCPCHLAHLCAGMGAKELSEVMKILMSSEYA